MLKQLVIEDYSVEWDMFYTNYIDLPLEIVCVSFLISLMFHHFIFLKQFVLSAYKMFYVWRHPTIRLGPTIRTISLFDSDALWKCRSANKCRSSRETFRDFGDFRMGFP